MWKTKYFNTQEEAEKFMINYQFIYRFQMIFVENGYGVEYKKLKNNYL